jgi:hypothetical protein
MIENPTEFDSTGGLPVYVRTSYWEAWGQLAKYAAYARRSLPADAQ